MNIFFIEYCIFLFLFLISSLQLLSLFRRRTNSSPKAKSLYFVLEQGTLDIPKIPLPCRVTEWRQEA